MPTIVVGTNSYETVAEADTYLDASIRAGASWLAVDPDTKSRALITAFRTFERELTLIDPDTGVAVDPATAPQGVKDAQSEYAFELSQDADLDTATGQGSNQKKVKAGSAEIEFFRPTTGSGESRFPKAVQSLLAPFLESPESGSTGNYASGLDCDSHFATKPDGINQGFA